MLSTVGVIVCSPVFGIASGIRPSPGASGARGGTMVGSETVVALGEIMESGVRLSQNLFLLGIQKLDRKNQDSSSGPLSHHEELR